MINLRSYLETKLRDTIISWGEDDVYAISFFLYANEMQEYNGYSNVTELYVSYNTENDCEGAGELSEKRWNYSFWRQNVTPIITVDEDNEGIKILFDWYKEQGINNIGYEDFDHCFDNEMRYIGKGPIGYYELLIEITAVAKNMQESGFIKNKFGSPIPIIIHDLEYPWYIIEANKQANPNGEADIFLAAMKNLGYIEQIVKVELRCIVYDDMRNEKQSSKLQIFGYYGAEGKLRYSIAFNNHDTPGVRRISHWHTEMQHSKKMNSVQKFINEFLKEGF